MNAIERLREALPPEPVMPDHDPMCRVYSGWPEIAAKGCNCSVAARAAGRDALAAVEALYQAAKAELGGDEKIKEYLEIMERNNTEVVDLTRIPRFALAAAVCQVGGE